MASRKRGQLPMYQFGVSTHLFHEHRLSREHLVHIAAHGFEVVELFATRAHFDYKSPEAIAEACRMAVGHAPDAAFDPRADRRAHAQRPLGRFVLERVVRREPPEAGRRRSTGRPRGRRTDPVSLPRRCTSAFRPANSRTPPTITPMLRAAASRTSRLRLHA